MSTDPEQRAADPEREPSLVARLLPVIFALALMAMAYWAASTWIGAEETASGASPAHGGG